MDFGASWGSSLEQRSWQVPFFSPIPHHKYRDTCQRQCYTDTCYLTHQQCTTPTSSPEDPANPSLLALSSGQILFMLRMPHPVNASAYCATVATAPWGMWPGPAAQCRFC